MQNPLDRFWVVAYRNARPDGSGTTMSGVLSIFDESTMPASLTAEQWAAREIWRVLPSRKPAAGTLPCLSAEWFRHLEYKRYRRHGRWIPQLFSFPRHEGEQVLVLGDGLGTEWVRYAEAGANVVVCEPSIARLQLVQHHFHVREVRGTFVHSPFQQLPSPDERQDVVSMFFHEPLTFALEPVLAEAYRVLRPGGKLLAVLPAHANAACWQHYALPWRWWRSEKPTGQTFRATTLRSALGSFAEVFFFKRQLRRSELAYVWRWIPLPIMERLMGRFLVVKAFKPVQATRTLRLAA